MRLSLHYQFCMSPALLYFKNLSISEVHFICKFILWVSMLSLNFRSNFTPLSNLRKHLLNDEEKMIKKIKEFYYLNLSTWIKSASIWECSFESLIVVLWDGDCIAGTPIEKRIVCLPCSRLRFNPGISFDTLNSQEMIPENRTKSNHGHFREWLEN